MERKRINLKSQRLFAIGTACGVFHVTAHIPRNVAEAARLHSEAMVLRAENPKWGNDDVVVAAALTRVIELEEVLEDVEAVGPSGKRYTVTIDPDQPGWKDLCRKHLKGEFAMLYQQMNRLWAAEEESAQEPTEAPKPEAARSPEVLVAEEILEDFPPGSSPSVQEARSAGPAARTVRNALV